MLILSLNTFGATIPMKTIQPPIAEIQPKKLVKHGITRVDNYFWIRERENPKVRAYLEAENDYLNHVLSPTEEIQKKLVSELRARIKEDDSSAPYKKGDYYYLFTQKKLPICNR
jgi:oligopeptidase B